MSLKQHRQNMFLFLIVSCIPVILIKYSDVAVLSLLFYYWGLHCFCIIMTICLCVKKGVYMQYYVKPQMYHTLHLNHNTKEQIY